MMTVDGPAAGLCATCGHARSVRSGRGSVFVLCGRAATDRRFRKYPPLPVVRCAGYEPIPAQPTPSPIEPPRDLSEADSSAGAAQP